MRFASGTFTCVYVDIIIICQLFDMKLKTCHVLLKLFCVCVYCMFFYLSMFKFSCGSIIFTIPILVCVLLYSRRHLGAFS